MEQSAIASGGRRHTASLAMRLAFSVALVLVVGGTVVALAAFAYGRQAAQQAFDRLLIGAADQIAGSISIQGGRVLVDIPASAFELLALAPDDRLLYAVLDPVEDPFVLAVRKGHPLAERERLTWADLAPFPLITVHRSSANRILLDSMLAKSGLSLHWTYEVTHLSTSLGLVEAGLGISVLPRMATPQGDHPFLVTHPIRDPEISRTIGVVRRRGASISPAAATFMNMLIGAWGDGPAYTGDPAAA